MDQASALSGCRMAGNQWTRNLPHRPRPATVAQIGASAAANLAATHALLGDPVASRRWLEKHAGLDLLPSWANAFADAGAHIATGLLSLDRLDPEGCAAALERLGGRDDGDRDRRRVLAAAAAELRALVAPFLQEGTVHRLPGRYCVIDHEGYRLVVSTDSWFVVGYDSRRHDRTYEQFIRGIPSRLQSIRPLTEPGQETDEDEWKQLVDEEPTGTEWSVMTTDDFAAMWVTERIQAERDDIDHEILRSDLRSALLRKCKADGGRIGESDDGVDAWYQQDNVTTVFEVLEFGGFDYQRFRQGALGLMEAAYMHCEGGKSVKVLVSQQPPEQEWIPKALYNVFDILVAWPEDSSWSGPGARYILPERGD
jgi:hypothetical protein